MDGGIGGKGCEGGEDLGALGYRLNKWRRQDSRAEYSPQDRYNQQSPLMRIFLP